MDERATSEKCWSGFRGEDVGDLNAFVMDEKINPKIVMDEELVQNGVRFRRHFENNSKRMIN